MKLEVGKYYSAISTIKLFSWKETKIVYFHVVSEIETTAYGKRFATEYICENFYKISCTSMGEVNLDAVEITKEKWMEEFAKVNVDRMGVFK